MFFCFCSQVAAKYSYVGNRAEVQSSEIVNIYNDAEHSMLQLKLYGLSPGEHSERSCEGGRTAQVCTFIKRMLTDANELYVEVSSFSEDEIQGDLLMDGVSLVEALIHAGYFRYDVSAGRSARMLHIQKGAYCRYRGIWKSNMGNPDVAKNCQSGVLK